MWTRLRFILRRPKSGKENRWDPLKKQQCQQCAQNHQNTFCPLVLQKEVFCQECRHDPSTPAIARSSCSRVVEWSASIMILLDKSVNSQMTRMSYFLPEMHASSPSGLYSSKKSARVKNRWLSRIIFPDESSEVFKTYRFFFFVAPKFLTLIFESFIG